MRRNLKWTAVAAALLAAGALVAQRPKAEPKLGSAAEVMAAARKADPASPLHVFADGEFCTVNLLAAEGPVPAHYHAVHEETVFVVRGEGTMRLGDERKTVRAGDLMHIPKGTVHAFEPATKDVLVVSIFAPKWDGKDRIFVGD